MGHKNYNNYSKKTSTPEAEVATNELITESVEPEVAEAKTEDVEVITGQLATETFFEEAATAEEPQVLGLVEASVALNMRSEPEINKTNIIAEIPRYTIVEIIDDTNDKFYKVTTLSGGACDKILTGYCMKEYIKILPAKA